ncbi:PKD domain-containing protein [Teredinibacter sp. KSP-S5-2]|uniref:PKD domain-containing protein n=1 Tax=Teredinibacter sp. KSP-S5-2 TaxID=3034506 RepID=UPI002934DD54|nr:metallophosphoesterase [Teredinibacter sp. KSP-S5-2]WNO08437.1 metallophosphoesterase [Teredinibacter sp. KSP-S5-2]
MKTRHFLVVAVCASIFSLLSSFSAYAALTREPYIQSVSTSSAVIRWRTSSASDSRVTFGTDLGNMTQTVDSPSSTTEHIVTLTGLAPDTRYYYAVGSSTSTEVGFTNEYYFETAPTTGSAVDTRIWVVGDPGTGDNNQARVRDAYYNFDNTHTDVMLALGDNAYNNGTENEYQQNFFDVYANLMRNTAVWPARGNHERDLAVHEANFTLPTNGEAGGTASGSELYFSFDHGNIHFVCLDSFTSSNLNGNAMYDWLEADLASTSQKWIIAYWHHPPYSRSDAHDSDSESGQRIMRERAVPILEKYGVDLALAGHNHFYSRTMLINNHYGSSSTFDANLHAIDSGDGQEAGTGAYNKGTNPEGAVYVLAGSSGKIGYSIIHHPANLVEIKVLGSVIVDVSNDRMDVKFQRETGTIADYFTIKKTPPVNTAPSVNAGADQAISLPADAILNGTVSDDGLPTSGALSVSWSKVSGPGNVTFANASSANTNASFSLAGTYVLRLTASDSELASTDDITITVNPPPSNQAPTVDAGIDQTVTLPNAAVLSATVTDDGLPLGVQVTTVWSVVSGPGTVTFTNTAAAITDASFSVDGSYVLRITASDTEFTAIDDITVTVNPEPPNQPPVVSAGPDLGTSVNSATLLAGASVTDDGKVSPVTLTWSQVSGPGVATFTDASQIQATVTFPVTGDYVLQVTANDGEFTVSDDVAVTVSDQPVVLEEENFETGFGNWVNSNTGDNYDWTRDSNGTPSSSTGPLTGANNSSWYVYLETSSGQGAYNAGDNAILEGPSISGSNRTLSFDYHMVGSNIGTLYVDVYHAGAWTNGVFSLSGQQQTNQSDAYLTANVDLGLYTGNIRVRFRSVAAGGWRGDIAIDNIKIQGIPGGGTGNNAPVFNADPIDKGSVAAGASFVANLANDAVDSDGDSLSFSKLSGPSWLNISANGDISGTPTATDVGTNSFQVQVSDGSLTDTATMTITVTEGDLTAVLLSDDFESDLGNWSNVAYDNYGWQQDSNGTPSSSTGPNTGAQGSVGYAYVETSNGSGAYNAGDVSIIESAPIYVLSDLSMAFDYHMYGSNMGTLYVDVFSNGTWYENQWSITGQQQASNAADYQSVKINLSAFTGEIKLRLRSVAAGGYRGDMAVDNIVVRGIADPNPQPDAGQAPSVNAGADQDISILAGQSSVQAVLTGSVSDDGLPLSGQLSSVWSGPSGVVFANANQANTTVTLPGAGSYTLTLEATDGMLSSRDSVTITVTENTTPIAITTLSNEVEFQGIDSDATQAVFFSFDVPAGRSEVLFEFKDGSGDADMYIKVGGLPSITDFDYKSELKGKTDEKVQIKSNIKAGTYYVLAYPKTAIRNAMIRAKHQD